MRNLAAKILAVVALFTACGAHAALSPGACGNFKMYPGPLESATAQGVCSAWSSTVQYSTSARLAESTLYPGNLACFADPTGQQNLVRGCDDVAVTWSAWIASQEPPPPADSPPGDSVTCNGTCTMTITLGWPELTSEKVSDYMELWGLFIAIGVVVLCLKSVYNRFRIDHD